MKLLNFKEDKYLEDMLYDIDTTINKDEQIKKVKHVVKYWKEEYSTDNILLVSFLVYCGLSWVLFSGFLPVMGGFIASIVLANTTKKFYCKRLLNELKNRFRIYSMDYFLNNEKEVLNLIEGKKLDNKILDKININIANYKVSEINHTKINISNITIKGNHNKIKGDNLVIEGNHNKTNDKKAILIGSHNKIKKNI